MRKLALTLYNLLFPPLFILLLPGYLLRIWRRGGYKSRAAQRFGIINEETMARIGTGRIWLHAVSVGEVGIALKFAGEFHRRNPHARFLISSTTSTGLAILEQHISEWLEPMANPVDFPIITSRLVKKLQPAVLLMIEADLWPNRLAACDALGIPAALLNARLSRRSEARFRGARFFTAPLFNQLALIALAEKEDGARWLSLGVSREILHWTGNIKYDNSSGASVPAAPGPGTFPSALDWHENDPLFLAASTHEGEELEVVRAYLQLQKEIPRLRLVIAPRHVERRTALVTTFRQLGLAVALRSEGATAPADLLLLDTTGELASWYPLAAAVFVGKSLSCSINHGGQNMIEPLQAGSPVLIGPHTGNFEPLASHLAEAGAAKRVNDADSIATTFRQLLQNPRQREQMIVAAQKVLASHQGATVRTCELVERLILQTSFTPTPLPLS